MGNRGVNISLPADYSRSSLTFTSSLSLSFFHFHTCTSSQRWARRELVSPFLLIIAGALQNSHFHFHPFTFTLSHLHFISKMGNKGVSISVPAGPLSLSHLHFHTFTLALHFKYGHGRWELVSLYLLK